MQTMVLSIIFISYLSINTNTKKQNKVQMFKQTFIWQNKLKQMKTRGGEKERILSFNSAYQQKLMSTGKKLHERQK